MKTYKYETIYQEKSYKELYQEISTIIQQFCIITFFISGMGFWLSLFIINNNETFYVGTIFATIFVVNAIIAMIFLSPRKDKKIIKKVKVK